MLKESVNVKLECDCGCDYISGKDEVRVGVRLSEAKGRRTWSELRVRSGLVLSRSWYLVQAEHG